ncbi:MAG: hypothetical protein SCH71_10080 [Desulfobulbaceae bacterium]|nr:hypothetical protein [Desulfobulbaceae bacterium]
MFKKKRYWFIVPLVLLAAVIAFLPVLLSTSAGSRVIVSRINESVPGSVSIGSFLVGWQQGFLCRDIVYEDPRRGLRINIPRLTGTQGLAELIIAPKNLGLVSMEAPVLELSLPEASRRKPADTPSQSAADELAFWEKLSVQLQAKDGLVTIGADAGQSETGMKDVVLHSRLSAGEMHYDLAFSPLKEQGDFAAQGRLNLPGNSRNLLATFFTDAEVRIRNFQFRDYLSFAADHSLLPHGEGVLNAEFRIKTLALEDFELSGSADITGLKLAGGVLGEDTPSFDNISLSLEKGKWSKLFWSVDKLHLVSDAGSFDYTGEYRNQHLQLSSRGDISIPVLFDRLPGLMRVHEGVFVESGVFSFTADMAIEGAKGTYVITSRIENLGGLFEGSPFLWDNPFTAIIHSENNGFDVRLKRLQVESPFLHVFGQGDLSSLNLEASADLEKAMDELGRLFHHPWTGSGDLKLSMKADSADQADRYGVNVDLDIGHFSLARLGMVVVPNHRFSAVGSARIPFSLLRDREGAFDLQFALSSWLGEIFFAMNGDQEEEGLADTRYSTDANFQLGRLVRLLRALDMVPETREMGGELQVQGSGYVDGSVVGFNELSGRIQDFSFTRNNTVFSDQEIRLYINRLVNDEVPSLIIHNLVVTGNREDFFSTGAGFNSMDLSASGLFLHNINLEAELGTMRLDELVVRDMWQPLDKLTAKGFLAADLQKMTPLLQNSDLLAPDIRLAGAGLLDFSAVDKGSGREIQADLKINAFALDRGGGTLLPADDVRLTLGLEERQVTDDLLIKELQFSSGPLELDAAGELGNSDAERELVLQGTITPNLEDFAVILNSAFNVDIAMQGRRSGAFDMLYRLPGKEKFPGGRIDFSTSVHADSLMYRGLHLSDITVPVSLADKTLQVRVQGRMNEGTVDVTATGDFNRDPAMILIPEQSRIMKDIQLREPVLEGVLQRIHPLFGVLASPTGQVDVQLDFFAWPPRPQGELEADFTALFDVSRVNLDNSGLLRSILSTFALEDEALKLDDAELRCRGNKGRITCSPLRILAGDAAMVLKGSAGMDKTLDYVLEVPITEKLVSDEVYQYLEGEIITVPIKGTVTRPAPDTDTAATAIRDLVKDAAVQIVADQADKLLPDLMERVLGDPRNQ